MLKIEKIIKEKNIPSFSSLINIKKSYKKKHL